jgi:PKD repeat protein
MYKKILLLIIVVIFCIAWTSRSSINTSVCTAGNEQKMPQLVSDGTGGAVIVWEDSRSSTDFDIYGQYLDASGKAKWAADGTALCTAIGAQHYPQVTADSSGGFIITWYDRRNGKNYDIYAQQIDSAGRIKWTSDGVAICTADGDQYDPMPVSDGRGGAIITWQDRRNGSDYDIYAQQIDASGSVKWNSNGISICPVKGEQETPRPVSDGRGGVIITWQDRRNGDNYDIYAQRIDANGTSQWTNSGLEICTAAHDQRRPQLVSDPRGAAIITWQDRRNGSDYDIYAQRIDISGTIQWTANGVALCTAENSQYDPRLASDGRGGAVITWQDYRKGSQCSFDAFAVQANVDTEICDEKQLNDWNIYAQYINSSGKIQWTANGVKVSTANVDQYKPQPVSDGFGGIIITWRAADKENDHNIYAQCVNSTGTLKWAANGVAVSTAPGNQYDPLLVSDGMGGAIVTWFDKREGNTSDIYAQKVCASGEIGGCSEPVAVIGADRLEGSAALTVNFNSRNSFDPDGAIIGWRWNFGDGKQALTENATHTYLNPGSYIVTLQVRDNNGKWSSPVRSRILVN